MKKQEVLGSENIEVGLKFRGKTSTCLPMLFWRGLREKFKKMAMSTLDPLEGEGSSGGGPSHWQRWTRSKGLKKVSTGKVTLPKGGKRKGPDPRRREGPRTSFIHSQLYA